MGLCAPGRATRASRDRRCRRRARWEPRHAGPAGRTGPPVACDRSAELPARAPRDVPSTTSPRLRRAARSACHCAVVARYARPPLRVAALRRNSREIVDAARPSRRATSCMVLPCARRSAISSRSANERYRPESGFADRPNIAGGMPPAFRNHLVPTACDTPTSTAASSLALPAAIAAQNRRRSSRPAADGRPGDDNGARPDRSERRRFRMFIATSFVKLLRRPLESALAALIGVVQ